MDAIDVDWDALKDPEPPPPPDGGVMHVLKR
jgi:hypothetical protein